MTTATIFYVKDEEGNLVAAKFLQDNGATIQDPNAGTAASVAIFDANGNPIPDANPNGNLIVPANYSVQSAAQFAQFVSDTLNAPAPLNWDSTKTESSLLMLGASHRQLSRAWSGRSKPNRLSKDATLSGDIPFSGNASVGTIELPGRPGTSLIRNLGTGPDFFSVYGIKFLSGRALSESHGNDAWRQDSTEANILINRAAAEYLGFSPQSALGKTLYSDNPNGKVKKVRLTIVGVTSDFMFEGDRRQISPTLYAYNPDDSMISVKVPPAGVSQAVSAIDRIWHGFAPSLAINRHFLDDDFEKQFHSDEQQGRIFAIFVGIAIFIASLGLFGLAALSTERRTREIGIRKAFGGRTKDIVLLLLWQFSIPVLLANVIAWPVAWYWLHDWLKGFAYRISLSPLYFITASAIALVVAWATVFVHARRVANANPIQALRYE